jgi:hypothetical protein
MYGASSATCACDYCNKRGLVEELAEVIEMAKAKL